MSQVSECVLQEVMRLCFSAGYTVVFLRQTCVPSINIAATANKEPIYFVTN